MPKRTRLKKTGSKARSTRLKKPSEIDVFYHLQEVLLKKDLDSDAWYEARTISMIEGFANSLHDTLVSFIVSGEGVSNSVAENAVALYMKDLVNEKKKYGDEPVDVTAGEVGAVW